MTCEKERRHREKEARLEKQRLMEAERNKVPSEANSYFENYTRVEFPNL